MAFVDDLAEAKAPIRPLFQRGFCRLGFDYERQRFIPDDGGLAERTHRRRPRDCWRLRQEKAPG